MGWSAWSACAAWAAPQTAQAAATRDLRVLTAADPATQRQVLLALRQRYPNLVADADPAALDAGKADGPIVTLGPAALRRALEAGTRSPLLAVFASSQACVRLIGEGPRTASAPAANATAVYADAPPAAQIQLVAQLFERRVTAGVLLSDASAHLERPLRAAAAHAGIDLLVEHAQPSADVARTLNRLEGVQVLLAVPDSTLYTPDTLRSLLESTYRRGLPVVGFSAATVSAGTLAAAYPDIDDVLADLADTLDMLESGPLPEPRFPRYWRVGVNAKVAHSLGVAVSDKVYELGVRPRGEQSLSAQRGGEAR